MSADGSKAVEMSGGSSEMRQPDEIFESIENDLKLLRGFTEDYQKEAEKWGKELQEKIWEWKIKQAQFEALYAQRFVLFKKGK